MKKIGGVAGMLLAGACAAFAAPPERACAPRPAVLRHKGTEVARAKETARLADCRGAFLARMSEKAKALGLASSRYANASGLTELSRTSAADLLKIGRAMAADPVLADAWSKTNATIRVAGPNSRIERIVHAYLKLKGFQTFVARYPFLGGKGGSLSHDGLSVRAHVVLTEVAGRRLLIAIAGQKFDGDPFAVDLAICDRVAAELQGKAPPSSPVLAAADADGVGYCYATMDGEVSFENANATKEQIPASTTKMVTALCARDIVGDVDRETLPIRSCDIVGGSGYTCYEGDVLNYRDAFLSLMLPSANTVAEAIGTTVGERILRTGAK